uniref:NF-X1-type domain-containing protein n=1 Tax=Romanomermis culicivorax TaxID=13658 RepID=A0A915JJD7_ROMCU
MVRVFCHCKLNEKLIPCREWCEADLEKRRDLSSCGNQCPKVLPCGHTCTKSCHLGNCSPVESCTKRIQVKCPCGRKTSKTQCYARRKMQNEISCDEECEKLKLEKAKNEKMSNADAGEAKSDNVESRDENQILLTRRKRKKKLRNESEDENSKSFYEKIYHSAYFKYSFVSLALGCCALFVYKLIFVV